MRVAIVIPCYNDQQFLPQALAAIGAEEATEVVVVDDGSDDPATLRLLDALAKTQVRVLHQRNAGPAAARMAGVAASQAPYVLPLDADDLNELPLSALFRREILLEAGGYQLRDGYEDWDLWMALAERGVRGIHVARLVERHREHGARRWSQDFSRHVPALTVLRERHPGLFAARGTNWRRSAAPWRQRLLPPVVEAAGFISAANRYRLAHLISHPLRFSRLQLHRLGVGHSSPRPRTRRSER